jgi:hypothetical protein
MSEGVNKDDYLSFLFDHGSFSEKKKEKKETLSFTASSIRSQLEQIV